MLIEYAGHEFSLNARQKDGATLRDHLESVYRQTRIMPKELEPKELPYAISYLWEWFMELQRGRQYGMSGALPLSYSDIKAWAELTGKMPQCWEIDVIKQIDILYINESLKKT